MTETDAGVRTIPADTFANRLKLARGDLTYTQAADRCGLSRENWANWEHGGKPRDLIDTVEKISAGLSIDRDWLFWGGPLTPEDRRPGRVISRRKDAAEQPTHYYGSGAARRMGSPLSGQPSSGDRRPNHSRETRSDDGMWRRTRRKDRPAT